MSKNEAKAQLDKNKLSNLSEKRRSFILISLVVPLILLLMFVVYPAVKLIVMSTTSWDGLSSAKKFIALDNYKTMFSDSDLWLSLRNNGIYFLLHFAFIPIELAIAVMLTTKMRAAKFYKSMVFLPYVINGVAIAYAFSYFYSPVNGAFNALLSALSGDSLIRNWLSDPKIVNIVLASVSIWRFSGYHIIIFISALMSVPNDIIEAATIDGANAWRKFIHIQIPSIQLVIDFILFDNVRGALQVFDIPFVMTNGGPGYASSTFTLYTINTAFTYNNFGLASAMAVAIMVLILLVHFIQSKAITSIRLLSEKRYILPKAKEKGGI